MSVSSATNQTRAVNPPSRGSGLEPKWKMTEAFRLPQNVRRYATINHHDRDARTFV
jgi:hypothetical protein